MDINTLLSNVLSGLSGDAARYTDAASSIGQAATGLETASNAAADVTREDIPKAQALAQGAADVDYQRNQLIQKLQQDAMLNPADAANAYTAGLAELTSINMERKAAARQVTELSSKGLLDDPFGYIMAQLSLPAAQAKLEGLDTQANIATSDVQTRLNLSKAAQSTIVADTSDKLKALAYQEADLKARAASSKLEITQAEVKSKIAGELMKQADALAKITQGKKEVYTMVATEENRKEVLDDRRTAREEARIEREKYHAAKKTSDERDAMRLAGLEMAHNLLGLAAPADVASFDKSSNTPQKKAISDIANSYNLGASLNDALPRLADASPNLNAILAGGNAGFAVAAKGLLQGADNAINAAMNTPDAMGRTVAPKVAREVGRDAYQSYMELSAGSPKAPHPMTDKFWDETFNVYKADYKKILTSENLLANNVVTEAAKLVAQTLPSSSGKFRGEDEQQVLRTIAALVAAGKINENDAAKQVSQFYKASAMINEDFYQYQLFGLPRQTGYMVRVDVPGMIGNTKVPANGLSADLMNEVDAKRLLLGLATELSGAQRFKSIQGFPSSLSGQR